MFTCAGARRVLSVHRRRRRRGWLMSDRHRRPLSFGVLVATYSVTSYMKNLLIIPLNSTFFYISLSFLLRIAAVRLVNEDTHLCPGGQSTPVVASQRRTGAARVATTQYKRQPAHEKHTQQHEANSETVGGQL